MKNTLIIFSLLISCLSFSQNIIGKWQIPIVLWNKAENQYKLSKTNNNEYLYNTYGNFIEFKQDGTFESYYSAPCGTDCFPESKGQYQLISKNKIILVVTHISQNEFCKENFEKNGKWSLGTYKIIKSKQDLFLKKIK